MEPEWVDIGFSRFDNCCGYMVEVRVYGHWWRRLAGFATLLEAEKLYGETKRKMEKGEIHVGRWERAPDAVRLILLKREVYEKERFVLR